MSQSGLAGLFFGDNSVGNTFEANIAVGNGASGFIIADRASDNTLIGNGADSS